MAAKPAGVVAVPAGTLVMAATVTAHLMAAQELVVAEAEAATTAREVTDRFGLQAEVVA